MEGVAEGEGEEEVGCLRYSAKFPFSVRRDCEKIGLVAPPHTARIACTPAHQHTSNRQLQHHFRIVSIGFPTDSHKFAAKTLYLRTLGRELQ